MITQRFLYRTSLELIIIWSRSAVGINIINIFRLQARLLNHLGDSKRQCLTFWIGRRDVIRITSRTISSNFTVDRGTACLRMLQSLHN